MAGNDLINTESIDYLLVYKMSEMLIHQYIADSI